MLQSTTQMMRESEVHATAGQSNPTTAITHRPPLLPRLPITLQSTRSQHIYDSASLADRDSYVEIYSTRPTTSSRNEDGNQQPLNRPFPYMQPISTVQSTNSDSEYDLSEYQLPVECPHYSRPKGSSVATTEKAIDIHPNPAYTKPPLIPPKRRRQ